jgi:hypothetical protein
MQMYRMVNPVALVFFLIPVVIFLYYLLGKGSFVPPIHGAAVVCSLVVFSMIGYAIDGDKK